MLQREAYRQGAEFASLSSISLIEQSRPAGESILINPLLLPCLLKNSRKLTLPGLVTNCGPTCPNVHLAFICARTAILGQFKSTLARMSCLPLSRKLLQNPPPHASSTGSRPVEVRCLSFSHNSESNCLRLPFAFTASRRSSPELFSSLHEIIFARFHRTLFQSEQMGRISPRVSAGSAKTMIIWLSNHISRRTSIGSPMQKRAVLSIVFVISVSIVLTFLFSSRYRGAESLCAR
jgi:hypothetical protein